MNEIKLGTMGSGFIVRAILDNMKRVDGISLVAVYSRTEEKGRALAAQYGAAKVYTELDTFLADKEMNFVYIATPNLLHYQQTKQALLAGKNVICEKPFDPKGEQLRELMALAEERGLLLMEAMPTAFLPNLDILKRELPKVGKIRLVQANYSQYSSRYDNLLRGELPNVFNPAFAGGCLMDINYYNVYLNMALFGRPQSADYYPNFFEGAADTSGVLMMRYDGFVSEATAAKDTWGVNFFLIEGEEGYIYVEGGSNGLAQIRVVTKTSEAVYNDQPDPDRYFYEVSNLTRLVLDDDRAAFRQQMDTTLASIETIETARKKAGILFPCD